MKWFLNWLEKRGRVLILREKDGQIYLKRYYILFKEKTNQFEEEKANYPFNLFIHQFHRSDLDDLHDHPWWFVTLVLKGGYYEEVPGGLKFKKPFRLGWRKSTDLHRVVLPEGKTCWTLFLRGPTKRKWGFVKNNQWIPSQEYLKNR